MLKCKKSKVNPETRHFQCFIVLQTTFSMQNMYLMQIKKHGAEILVRSYQKVNNKELCPTWS